MHVKAVVAFNWISFIFHIICIKTPECVVIRPFLFLATLALVKQNHVLLFSLVSWICQSEVKTIVFLLNVYPTESQSVQSSSFPLFTNAKHTHTQNTRMLWSLKYKLVDLWMMIKHTNHITRNHCIRPLGGWMTSPQHKNKGV